MYWQDVQIGSCTNAMGAKYKIQLDLERKHCHVTLTTDLFLLNHLNLQNRGTSLQFDNCSGILQICFPGVPPNIFNYFQGVPTNILKYFQGVPTNISKYFQGVPTNICKECQLTFANIGKKYQLILSNICKEYQLIFERSAILYFVLFARVAN